MNKKDKIYPKLPRDKDKRFKVTIEQLKNAKELKVAGLSYALISKLLGVPSSTLKYNLNESLRKKQNKKKGIIDHYRWFNDKEFKKCIQEMKKKSITERREWDDKIVKYNKIRGLIRHYKKQQKKAGAFLSFLGE